MTHHEPRDDSVASQAKAIAAALPHSMGAANPPLAGDWSVSETGHAYAYLAGPDDVLLTLSWQERGSKLHVSVAHDTGSRWYGWQHYRDSPIEATMRSTQEAGKIAATITQRLHRPITAMLATITARQKHDATLAAVAARQFDQLTEVAGLLASPPPVAGATSITATTTQGMTITARSEQAGGITLTLHCLSLEQVQRLIPQLHAD